MISVMRRQFLLTFGAKIRCPGRPIWHILNRRSRKVLSFTGGLQAEAKGTFRREALIWIPALSKGWIRWPLGFYKWGSCSFPPQGSLHLYFVGGLDRYLRKLDQRSGNEWKFSVLDVLLTPYEQRHPDPPDVQMEHLNHPSSSVFIMVQGPCKIN